MKKLIIGILIVPLLALAQQTPTQPVKISTDKNYPAIEIVGSTNQVASYIVIKNENGTVARLTTNLVWTSSVTTNQLVFAATNSAPADITNVVKWISVQVTGDTNSYRLPLYK